MATQTATLLDMIGARAQERNVQRIFDACCHGKARRPRIDPMAAFLETCMAPNLLIPEWVDAPGPLTMIRTGLPEVRFRGMDGA